MSYARKGLWGLGALALFAALPALFGSYGWYLGSALCVWIIFALAYDLSFGRTGLLSFGHAMFFGIGAYAPALIVPHLHWGFWPTLGGAIASAGLFSFIVGAVALRVSGHAFVVITVIFGSIVELFAYSRKNITNGEDGLSFNLDRAPLFVTDVDLTNSRSKYALMIAFATAVFLLLAWINSSSFGLACRAIRENSRRAMLLGYPVQRYKLAAFTISGALSGLAGALFSLLNFNVSSEVFQISVSITPLTSVLVGGTGTMLGPVIGTAFIYILSDYLRSLIVYADLGIGVILVLTVLFAPQGIVGLLDQFDARRRTRGGMLDQTLTPSLPPVSEELP